MMPKGRYKIMTGYMPKVGRYGPRHDVPDLHGADQSRLLLRSRHGQESSGYRWRCSRWRLRCSPNSPFTEGKPNGFLSFRSEIWARHRQCARRDDSMGRSRTAWDFERWGRFTRWTCRCISSSVAMLISTSRDRRFRDFFRGQKSGISRRASDAVGLGPTIFRRFSPEVRFEALSGNARRRRRAVETACRRCRRSGSDCSMTTPASMPHGDIAKALERAGAPGAAR